MKDKPHCLMPFIHYHVSNNGLAKACCVANITYGNTNTQTLEEIWNGKNINQLRDKFSKNEIDKRCFVCHKIEASGGKSIRLETFDKFDYQKIDSIPRLPIYFDIRFSNVCNFRCRTCWHGASSKWFNDAKSLNTNIGEKAIIKNIDDLDKFINSSREALLGAEEFYFAGGEPLVTEEHYKLLEWLIQNNATKSRLRYNTNFSKLEFKGYDLIDLWSHFDEVELLASIDASNTLGEYIRKDMKWQDILKNRKVIEAYPFIKFKIAPTVSILNVFHIPELYEECIQLNMIKANDLYLNILERPSYYNIQILPKEIKQKVIDKYLRHIDASKPKQINQAFQSILDYMMEEDRSDLYELFLEKNTQLDRLREEQNPSEILNT
jgi:molybdenum cofactor biosynthesis enzyme MoaA